MNRSVVRILWILVMCLPLAKACARQPDLTIDQESFYTVYQDFYRHKKLHALKKKYRLEGSYFYSEKHCLPNQAYIGRMLVTCCIAHAVFIGFVVQFPKPPTDLRKGDWVVVEGTAARGETKRGKKFLLRVSSIKKKPRHVNPYVYP